jgi:hypothetical protein
MKIIRSKSTQKVVAFAAGNNTDLSHLLGDADLEELILPGDELPDRMEACKYDGSKFTIDQTEKKKAEDADVVQQLIREKAEELRRQAAIDQLITDGVLNPDGTLKES